MMITFPKEIEDKLGIGQIKELIRQKCKSDYGVEFLNKVKPSTNHEEINKWLTQTQEFVTSITSGLNVPARDFQDIRPFIKRIRASGSFLQSDEFANVKAILTTLYEWTRFFKSNKDAFPNLTQLTYGFIADLELVNAINLIVDERGEVRNNASPELAAIRNLIIQKERAVRTEINKVLKKSIKDEFTDDDSSVTIRDGRLVIPVRAEHKRRVPGFIHDESSTGQTVFLEPTEVLQLNNEVRDLQYQERREIIKILTRLTDLMRQSLVDIEKGSFFLGLIDFINAKAVLAIDIEATQPVLHKAPMIKWNNARHPLLYLSHKTSKKSIVPLSLSLSRQDNRILVISGPNAGGKSVALKTVGLLQYMLQCGFLVPVDEHSEFGVFNGLLLDIGDTQSLENDLSTYSSHLTSMKYFNEICDKNSLVLIDEFGTGTEPQFGGAIAESILTQLNRKKTFGLITTHYQNLKKFAENSHGVINGAMRYDLGNLEPLFELEIGKPGSSFAFEIARKIGLPKGIIEDAKSMVGTSQVAYEHLLTDLEKEKAKYHKLNKKLEKEEKDAMELRADYEQLRSMVDSERKEILKKAKEEAKFIITRANKDIENTIREIKESQADKKRTAEARQKLVDKKADSKITEPVVKPKLPLFKPGDAVILENQETTGEIMSVKGKQAQVRFGNIISFIDLNRLKKSKAQIPTSSPTKKMGGFNMVDKMSRFSGEIDVRGMRAEEALTKVDAYVDNALLLGTDSVRLLHGKGYGILKEVLRNHLKSHPSIATLNDEHIDYGGAGITVVTFK
ncbi:MAG: Smr/MutS family protein [Cyclobacteriaceae bacterium]